MTKDGIDGVIESQDPAVDVASVMREVRARIRARRSEAEAQALDYDAFAEGRSPHASTIGLDAETQDALRNVTLGYDKIQVELSLTASRVPVVGSLMQRIRHALHSVILYYLNQLAAKQIRFNEAVARSLRGIVRAAAADQKQEEDDALRDEITRLRKRVEALEVRLRDECG